MKNFFHIEGAAARADAGLLLLRAGFGGLLAVTHGWATARGALELAVHFLFAFTVLALTGPGRFSVDGWRARTRKGSLS